MLLNARRLHQGPGADDRILLVIEDVTDRRDAEDARREAETRFTEMVRNVRDHSIFLTDPGGVITSWNVSAERILGHTEAEAVGRHFSLIFTPEDVRNGLPEWELRTAREEGRAEDERWHLRKGGERFWALGIVTPTRDAAGTHTGYSKILRDVTDRKRAEDALRASEERLRQALAAARMGTWTLEVGPGEHLRDPNLNALLGLGAADTTQPFDDFLARIHPDDRAVVRAAFATSVRERQPLNVEFRVVRPDGSVRWLRDQGDVFPGDGGGPRMAGACVDVTERRAAEEALRRSEERVRLILESATDFAIFTLAPDRTVTSWSPGAAATFGYTEGEIVGRPGDVIYTPEDRAAGVPAGEAEEARRAARAADERWHVRKDGTRIWASGTLARLTGGAAGFVKVLRDTTDRKRLADALHRARVELEERVRERTAELERAMDALEAEMTRRRELARQVSAAQEAERLRVSRDLHDALGQLQAGLGLALAAARRVPGLPPAADERLAEVDRLADALARETHALAVRLRPTALDDLGLEPALRQLVADWAGRTAVAVEFDAAGLVDTRLPAEVETAVYRLVQEALSNVAKHSRAARVSVSAAAAGGRVSVAVEDDGVGFDPAAGGAGRLGLVGMRERAELAGGDLVVESEPGAGTTVLARFPLPAR
jgi:PAS domain S-box-containing protein